MIDPPGYALVLVGIFGTFFGVLKGLRTRNWLLFTAGLTLQAGAQAFLTYIVVGNLSDLSSPSSMLFVLAVISGGLSVATDALLSWIFVSRAIVNDASLTARTVLLFGLPGLGLAGAGFFRINWDWDKVEVGDLRWTESGDAAWPTQVILCTVGVGAALLGAALGAVIALVSAVYGGSAEKSDRCARVWFALFFVNLPICSVILGVSALVAPQPLIGRFILINFIVLGPFVACSLALLRDVFKSTEGYYY